MGFFSKKGSTVVDAVPRGKHSNATSTTQTANPTPIASPKPSLEIAADEHAHVDIQHADFKFEQLPVTPIAIILGAIASIGGFIFGYESGQISGTFSPN